MFHKVVNGENALKIAIIPIGFAFLEAQRAFLLNGLPGPYPKKKKNTKKKKRFRIFTFTRTMQ